MNGSPTSNSPSVGSRKNLAFIEDSQADYALFTKHLGPIFAPEHFLNVGAFLASGKHYDLVISDLGFSDTWFFETTDKLKDVDAPVVILTGLGKGHLDAVKMEFMQEGFQHVLSKDMGPENFASYMKENFG